MKWFTAVPYYAKKKITPFLYFSYLRIFRLVQIKQMARNN